MDIINFDSELNDDNKKYRNHFLLPACHYLFVAATGCGKTNLLCNMLLRWMHFDECTIYTINQNQDKYNCLNELSGILKSAGIDNFIKFESPNNITPVEDLDIDTVKVIVFDDIKIDRESMDRVKEYFSLSRNKNCNCLYLTQSFYDVPKYIRRNTQCFVLFDGLDNRDIAEICRDHSKNIKPEEFKQIYQMATSEPYSFMVFDKTTNNIPEMYRKRFDQYYIPVQ
jgi:hypothetical protein